MQHLVGIIKQEDQYRVLTYEERIFKGRDLKYLSTAQAKLVKERFLRTYKRACQFGSWEPWRAWEVSWKKARYWV